MELYDMPLLSVQNTPFFVKITKQLLDQNCVYLATAMKVVCKEQLAATYMACLWKWV